MPATKAKQICTCTDQKLYGYRVNQLLGAVFVADQKMIRSVKSGAQNTRIEERPYRHFPQLFKKISNLNRKRINTSEPAWSPSVTARIEYAHSVFQEQDIFS